MFNKIVIILIIIIAAGFYAFTLRGVSGNPQPETIKTELDQHAKPFELSPERGRFAHVMTLAQTGQYALTQQLADFVYPDVGYYDGKFYSYFAPGISYMSLPFYLLGQKYDLSQVATFGFVSLVSILGLIFLYKISREMLNMPIWASLASVLIFGFASTAWSYAITLYQHHFTTFFLLSSIYAIWKFKRHSRFAWAWAGWAWIALALSFTVDYPNAFLMLPVAIYFFVASFEYFKDGHKVALRWRTSFILTFVLFVALTLLHSTHNKEYFGNPMRLAGSIVGYKQLEEQNLLDQGGTDAQNAVSELQERKDNVLGFFSEEKVPRGLVILFVSTDRGLFIYTPIFLLAIFGFLHLRKLKSLEVWVLLGFVLFNIFLYASWGDPWGGWAYGTRYLIPSMSILSLAIGYWLSVPESKFGWLKKLIASVLFVYSSAIALLGALTTNANPPRIEGDYLGMKYNFFRNIDFLKDNTSGSFLYNTYFVNEISLTTYYFIILGSVVFVFLLVIFILPLFKRKGYHGV